jgi:hypothetical protein
MNETPDEIMVTPEMARAWLEGARGRPMIQWVEFPYGDGVRIGVVEMKAGETEIPVGLRDWRGVGFATIIGPGGFVYHVKPREVKRIDPPPRESVDADVLAYVTARGMG